MHTESAAQAQELFGAVVGPDRPNTDIAEDRPFGWCTK